MNELDFGTRNKRGDYRPNTPLTAGMVSVFAWLKSYIFGWNCIFILITLLYWFFVIPPLSEMATLGSWALKLLLVNMLGIFLFYGAFELHLYIRKRQENRFKYNGKFPSDQPSDVFWFHSQNLDNFCRSLFVTVPIGTAIEVISLWALASGLAPMGTNPIWIALLILFAPIIHESYFFFIHWLIHQGWLYKYVHSVHHNSINPSPWSSMSMHPVEGALYFGTLPLQLLIFANPFTLIWQWNIAAYGAVVGHIGFDKIEIGEGAIGTHAYAHYLHHKHFEVNYCDDGVLPWDQWFGTWHDGSPEGDARMQERFQKKKLKHQQRLNKGTK